jgi:hypothetical protein
VLEVVFGREDLGGSLHHVEDHGVLELWPGIKLSEFTGSDQEVGTDWHFVGVLVVQRVLALLVQ